MKFEEIIRSISDGFTLAWNEWDIDAMLSYLSADVIVQSPQIKYIYPDNTKCELVGKDAAREYWIRLAEKKGKFKVTQTSVTKTDRAVNTINKVVGQDITIKETFMVNEYGKIEYLKYEYE